MLTILVTGASGLIGGALCAELVRRGNRVAALTHNRADIRGNDRARVPVWRTFRGNIGEDGLGLGEQARDELGDPDLVIHCAASTRFDLDPAAHRAINVDGTAKVIDFARTTGARLLHMSTVYASGLRDGPVPEEPVPADARFANGYEASKADAETLVRDSGVPHAIVRPSIVLGDYASGAIREFGAIYAAFRLLAEGRVTHMPAAPGATLNFVPIDHVVRTIIAIVERITEADSGIFQLVADPPIGAEEFVAVIRGYPQFGHPHLVDTSEFDSAALPPRERRLFARILEPYATYFERDPRFDDSATRALTGIAAPVCDAAFLRRQIDFAIRAGFLPA